MFMDNMIKQESLCFFAANYTFIKGSIISKLNVLHLDDEYKFGSKHQISDIPASYSHTLSDYSSSV